MDHAPTQNGETKSTGRQYGSMEELLRVGSPEIAKKVRALAIETRVTGMLAAARVRAGLTQAEMGRQMNPPRTQSAVSKLESDTDDNLKLSDLKAYAQVLNERIGVVYGPPLNPFEAIRSHAKEMKQHMLSLVDQANGDPAIEKEVQAFFSNHFVDVLTSLTACHWSIPNKDAIKIEMAVIEPAALQVAEAALPARDASERVASR